MFAEISTTVKTIRGITWYNLILLPGITEYSETIRSIAELPEISVKAMESLKEANINLASKLAIYDPYIVERKYLPTFMAKALVEERLFNLILELTDDLFVKICQSYVNCIKSPSKRVKHYFSSKNGDKVKIKQNFLASIVRVYCTQVDVKLKEVNCKLLEAQDNVVLAEDIEKKVAKILNIVRLCKPSRYILTDVRVLDRILKRCDKFFEIILTATSEALAQYWHRRITDESGKIQFVAAINRRARRIHGYLNCCVYLTALRDDSQFNRPLIKEVIFVLEWSLNDSKNAFFVSKTAIEKITRPLVSFVIANQAIIKKKIRLSKHDPFSQIRSNAFMHFFIKSMIFTDNDVHIMYNWARSFLERNRFDEAISKLDRELLVKVPRLIHCEKFEEILDKLKPLYHFPGAGPILPFMKAKIADRINMHPKVAEMESESLAEINSISEGNSLNEKFASKYMSLIANAKKFLSNRRSKSFASINSNTSSPTA